MRKSHFTEAPIIGMIKKQEAGIPTKDMCRKHGLSQGGFMNSNSNPAAGTKIASQTIETDSNGRDIHLPALRRNESQIPQD